MLTIFGFPTSPYVRKVLLVIAEKGLETDLVPATPHKPTDAFLAASPFRMMPAMADGDFTLPDSTAIFMYLDAKHPEPPLLPASPEGRGRAMWFDEFADTILSNWSRTIGFNRTIGPALLGLKGDEQAAARAQTAATPALDWLETQVPETGWLVGEGFSLADISVASAMRTMMYGLDPDFLRARPRISAWFARVEERAAWRQVKDREEKLWKEAVASGEHRQA
ncbi:glutathione S-transferase family protein [Aurantiacibacter hainanensis]|uniref:glutathione S-transferase family protein n=1 Tax=Aurantiacibacter hainanensis TaxID=3076114 RepID=UPI0030C77A43